MDIPKDITIPFFAYGIFQPGQIAYFKLEKFVYSASKSQINGKLLIRDGLALYAPGGSESDIVDGYSILFKPDYFIEAYKAISEFEPDHYYKWSTTSKGNKHNVLEGKCPGRGGHHIDDKKSLDSWNDPLFTGALDVIKKEISTARPDSEFNGFFRLQMAYMLLWSSIERYLTLRHCLGCKGVVDRIRHLDSDEFFIAGLKRHVNKVSEKLYRTDNPGERELKLDPANPKKSREYYYQMRSNITHRGKSQFRDYDRLKYALETLTFIFEDMLSYAFKQAIETKKQIDEFRPIDISSG